VNELGPAILSSTSTEIRRAKPVDKLESHLSYFTLGSTKDDVLRIQGSPDRFTKDMFWYGASAVRFNGDRVVSWSNSYPKMKARLLPRAGTNAPEFFTVGSSKDEVIAVQGSPDRFTKDMFWYGASAVRFNGDRVVSWSKFLSQTQGGTATKLALDREASEVDWARLSSLVGNRCNVDLGGQRNNSDTHAIRSSQPIALPLPPCSRPESGLLQRLEMGFLCGIRVFRRDCQSDAADFLGLAVRLARRFV
jgi:hypothetical protein